VTPVDPIVELFELKQVLVDRIKRLNFIILADEAEERHSLPPIALLDSSSPVLDSLKFAESNLGSIRVGV
jgi:hypothetical protein